MRPGHYLEVMFYNRTPVGAQKTFQLDPTARVVNAEGVVFTDELQLFAGILARGRKKGRVRGAYRDQRGVMRLADAGVIPEIERAVQTLSEDC
mmetsp:Transcript_19340/g.21648  ORF Transcript_19340/g.21648 Transcript_19340/m.21648 type:complete len:93 (-) Transcript_19340:71-349(-)